MSSVTVQILPKSAVTRQLDRIVRLRQLPLFSICVLLSVAVVAVAAPWLAPHPEAIGDLRARLTPPVFLPGGDPSYVLGTDASGRDILSRIMYGARASLSVAVVGVALAGAIGVLLGLVAGFRGGKSDMLVSAAVDVTMAMPAILFALTLAVAVRPGFGNVLFIVALVFWGRFARMARSEVISLKERDYVRYARKAGGSDLYIMLRHILPGLVPTLSVFASLIVGQVILVEAALSFLGVGLPPPAASWGNMVSDGRSVLNRAWWVSVVPGLAIMLVVLASNNVGDWLRDRFDPRLGQP